MLPATTGSAIAPFLVYFVHCGTAQFCFMLKRVSWLWNCLRVCGEISYFSKRRFVSRETTKKLHPCNFFVYEKIINFLATPKRTSCAYVLRGTGNKIGLPFVSGVGFFCFEKYFRKVIHFVNKLWKSLFFIHDFIHNV